MIGQALITSPFGVGAVVTALIALTFWLDSRFRLFSFPGTAIPVITGGAAPAPAARPAPHSPPLLARQQVPTLLLPGHGDPGHHGRRPPGQRPCHPTLGPRR